MSDALNESHIEDLVSELVGRFGQAGVPDRARFVDDATTFLKGVGADDAHASVAVARWVADNDA